MSILMDIAVVVPAHNEEKHIKSVISRIKKVSKDYSIIVVNDGSSDNTSAIASKESVTVLNHIINMGKGAAAKTGCDYAYRNRFDIIVLIDGDGQHEPEDIPRFVEKLSHVDIVFGYRRVGNVPFVYRVGNWALTQLSKILFHMGIIDTQSGFRAFTRKTYRKIRWQSRNYGMESEMIYRAQRLKYEQIPIKNIYLDNHKGTTILDGIKIAINMIRWKLLG